MERSLGHQIDFRIEASRFVLALACLASTFALSMTAFLQRTVLTAVYHTHHIYPDTLFVEQDVDDVEEEDDHGEVSSAPADGAGQHQHRHEASVSVGVGCVGRTDDSMDQAGQR